jgi:hypothetical protein
MKSFENLGIVAVDTMLPQEEIKKPRASTGRKGSTSPKVDDSFHELPSEYAQRNHKLIAKCHQAFPRRLDSRTALMDRSRRQ